MRKSTFPRAKPLQNQGFNDFRLRTFLDLAIQMPFLLRG
jgi:hypothetical protein